VNLKQLEYFVSVAELGSFSKAALVLDIAQPALSRQVRALEIELRETLLLRNGRGVSLTEPGRRLYEHSLVILRQVAQACEDLSASRDEPVGRITVGLPPSMGRQLTLALVDGFRRSMPRARLTIVEGLSAHISEWLGSGRVDVGLLYNPDAQANLEIRPLLHERLCLVQQQPVQHRVPLGPVSLRDVVELPLVLPERQHVIRRLLDNQATLAGLSLNVAWEVSSVAAILDLVCAGYGHAILTASSAAVSGRHDELLVRPLVQPELISVLCLATSAHQRTTPLMRQTTRLLADLVTALPQGTAARSLPG